MENSSVVMIIMMTCLVLGIVLNYNAGLTFGTNLIVIGLIGGFAVKVYDGSIIL